ncbi:MAG: TetR/AcrR family transcriptional regulator [Clostridiales bacterium]|jgi:AcrR family transcriptional regulator|nr:TetR/AcrR family transcriptional regulator [Clostridiales bacterium]
MSKVKFKQIQRRSELIEKLIPYLNSTPFDELSVADICRAAEISIGSFYHYFNKKSDLLVGLLSLIDDYMADEVFPLLTDEDELVNIKRFAHEWAIYVNTHGIDRSKLISGAPPFNIDYNGNKRLSIIKLENIIAAGQNKLQITSAYGADILAEYILLSVRAVTSDWSRHDGSYDIVARMDAYISFIILALKP